MVAPPDSSSAAENTLVLSLERDYFFTKILCQSRDFHVVCRCLDLSHVEYSISLEHVFETGIVFAGYGHLYLQMSLDFSLKVVFDKYFTARNRYLSINSSSFIA